MAGAYRVEAFLGFGVDVGRDYVADKYDVVAGVHVLSPGQKVKRYVPPRATNAPATPAAPAASR